MSAPDRKAMLDREHPELSMRRQCAMLGIERWPGESGRSDKWGFCLTRAKMAVGQER